MGKHRECITENVSKVRGLVKMKLKGKFKRVQEHQEFIPKSWKLNQNLREPRRKGTLESRRRSAWSMNGDGDAIKDKVSSFRKRKPCLSGEIEEEQKLRRGKCTLTIRDVGFIATRYDDGH